MYENFYISKDFISTVEEVTPRVFVVDGKRIEIGNREPKDGFVFDAKSAQEYYGYLEKLSNQGISIEDVGMKKENSRFFCGKDHSEVLDKIESPVEQEVFATEGKRILPEHLEKKYAQKVNSILDCAPDIKSTTLSERKKSLINKVFTVTKTRQSDVYKNKYITVVISKKYTGRAGKERCKKRLPYYIINWGE